MIKILRHAIKNATRLCIFVFFGILFGTSVIADGTPLLWKQVSWLLVQERKVLESIGYDRLALLSGGASSEISLEATAAQQSQTRIAKIEQINAMPRVTGGAEWQCLAEALYFEARGETLNGQFAVAEVILNRRDSEKFPNSICEVVGQGTQSGKRHACQFSYKCDGLAEVFSDTASYDQVGKVARIMLDGKSRNLTKGATYYHTGAVRPKWGKRFQRTLKVGSHYFYRG